MPETIVIRETRHEAAIRKAREASIRAAEAAALAEAPVALRFKFMLRNYATSRGASRDAADLLRPDAVKRLCSVFPPARGLDVAITQALACRDPAAASPAFPFGCEAQGTVTGRRADAMAWMAAAAAKLAEKNGKPPAEQKSKKEKQA